MGWHQIMPARKGGLDLNLVHWEGILESLLFVAGDEGLTLQQMKKIMEIPEHKVLEVIESLKESYRKDPNRGIMLVEMAGTYQLATKKENAEYLKRLVETPPSSSLSQAALETLTIIAYKQPITKVEIEEIRGVRTERPLQTLIARGLIQEVGRKDGPGRAILYGTTREFLDYFGLKDISELPPLPEEDDKPIGEEPDLFYTAFSEDQDE